MLWSNALEEYVQSSPFLHRIRLRFALRMGLLLEQGCWLGNASPCIRPQRVLRGHEGLQLLLLLLLTLGYVWTWQNLAEGS